MKLSDYVREYRLKKGWSQKRMSEFLDISRVSMSFVENDRAVGMPIKHKIAEKLGMEYEEIHAMEKNSIIKPRKKADLDTEIERLQKLKEKHENS